MPEIVLGDSGIIPWPEAWRTRMYNSNEPCDVLIGPCNCGAWHTREDKRVQAALRFYNATIVEGNADDA